MFFFAISFLFVTRTIERRIHLLLCTAFGNWHHTLDPLLARIILWSVQAKDPHFWHVVVRDSLSLLRSHIVQRPCFLLWAMLCALACSSSPPWPASSSPTRLHSSTVVFSWRDKPGTRSLDIICGRAKSFPSCLLGFSRHATGDSTEARWYRRWLPKRPRYCKTTPSATCNEKDNNTKVDNSSG